MYQKLSRSLFISLIALQVFAGASCSARSASVKLTRAPYIQSTTTSSAYIVWNTDGPATSTVSYRGSLAQWQQEGSTEKVRQHIVFLAGLRPATRYEYKVLSDGKQLAEANFETAKLPGQPFTIAVWGDSGYGDKNQYALARRIDAAQPDLMLHTGDLIYEKGAAEDFDPKFFKVYEPTLQRASFYGCLGNHDLVTDRGQPFLDAFVFPTNGPPETPEKNFSFDYADAHVVVLDVNVTGEEMEKHMVPWLEQDLKQSKALWKFAVFHQPVYSSGLHGDTARCRRVLAPIFSRYKVDVVFNGHDHDYERFKPQEGVVYIVTGAGGASRYFRKEFRDITARWWNADWSFTKIEINGRTLHGQQIDTKGEVVDDWSLTK